MNKKNKNLPRIACFHGGGSRAAIHEIQCSFLIPLLENDFQFEFFEGPFDRSAGPGILPAFPNYDPYKSWFAKDETGAELSDGSGYENTGRDGVERMWRMMEERQEGQGGEFVGVMGFSQGTRMAGGLLLDQQRRKDLGLGPPTPFIRLQFGILCMGGGAPMEPKVGTQTGQNNQVVRIPTLHMHGLRDEFLSLGRQQYANYYDEGAASLFEVDYHHAMPWNKEDSKGLAQRIRTLYQTTRGNL